MKIINFKINLPKILLFISIIIAIIFLILAILRFFNLATNEEITMTNENYTDILKDCHENIDNYIGKKIYLTGYIFRLEDFKENEAVIARDMLINNSEAQVVGFLCQHKDISKFENNSWVEISGEITRGVYHGEIPIIKIQRINKITTPEEIFVYPPTNN